MAKTESTMLPLGTLSPDFTLINVVNDQPITLNSYAHEQPVMIAFICNHCPFVKHMWGPLLRIANAYQKKGIAIIAISSNSIKTHPEDGPKEMQQLAIKSGVEFPYCYDETQEVAKSYDAACTPDFYLFNAAHQLVYRGQFDDSRPGNGKTVSGADLSAAMDALLSGAPISSIQYPSIGCNIKWDE